MSKRYYVHRGFVIACLLLFFVLFFVGYPKLGRASTLSVAPSAGTFTVGSTFNVSVLLDTEGESVNLVDLSLSFPADKLQVVSPGTEQQSIIGIWTSPPRFNNQTGTIDLQGGIPGGTTVSNGLVYTIKFRVKQVGSAIVRFRDKTRILLNDGLGTDALKHTQGGVFSLVLPPPAGPIVASETHSEQPRWYANSSLVLRWATDESVGGFSYVLNNEPVDIPDDISEGVRTGVSYKDLADGHHYFHIKALRNGFWGGTTHFGVSIDNTPPAEFPVEIIPAPKTTRRQPVIQFTTSDKLSGIDHYELKIVPLEPQTEDVGAADQSLFFEAQSPYVIQPMELGAYDVIVRAYDKAGNYREVIQRMDIVPVLFKFISEDGIEIRGIVTLPWPLIWVFSISLLIALAYLGWLARKWHRRVELQKLAKQLPEETKKQLEELRKYRTRYRGKMLLLLVIFGTILFSNHHVFAQQSELAPALVTTISKNISNEEIFYV